MARFGVALAVCLVLVGAAVAEEGGAQLLVQKAMLTNKHFAGSDVPVRYRIFNVGNGAAYNVQLEDEWSPEEFETVSGLSAGNWAKIPAGGNISHIVVVKAHTYGYKTTSSARVTYKQAPGSDETHVVHSNDLGLLPVLSLKDDDKMSNPHLAEWGLFLLAAVALVVLPIVVFQPPAPVDKKKTK
eukprot:CAMPEP_0173392506 /NCGR_PEP_ID=MMETSP1356-20130122/19888_1 /TAXON_ID=77927 ORGANISM="Hemiselmis virescens, Strain PCC157" /NCGR_SAMPLE_ID=MMETSP1356 /ASSEMBLY_ACC=CAM_ASM_000847 /LENGTH=184 /DNA_ID=CAMNT_0014350317 /DNA_START=18 /DNA_END=572 /DNA_ORIENTATION=+